MGDSDTISYMCWQMANNYGYNTLPMVGPASYVPGLSESHAALPAMLNPLRSSDSLTYGLPAHSGFDSVPADERLATYGVKLMNAGFVDVMPPGDSQTTPNVRAVWGEMDTLANSLSIAYGAGGGKGRSAAGLSSTNGYPSASALPSTPCLTRVNDLAGLSSPHLSTVSPLAANSLWSQAHLYSPKWDMAGAWTSAQLQYMVLQKQPKVEKTNRTVRCETCGLTLNSEQQAKQHFTGKSHYKKMKSLGLPIPDEARQKLAKAAQARSEKSQQHATSSSPGAGSPSSSDVGNGNQPNAAEQMPSGFRAGNQTSPGGTPLPAGAGMGNQNASVESIDKMDPVSKAVYNNMMEKLPKKRKKVSTCDVCSTTFNSDIQAEAHFRGSRHNKKIKLMEAKGEVVHTPGGDVAEKSPGGGSDVYFCSLCNVGINSEVQYQQHVSENHNGTDMNGTKHKRLWGSDAAETTDASCGLTVTDTLDELPGHISGMFHCGVCNISVPTPSRLQKHVNSDAHKQMQADNSAATEQPAPHDFQ